MTAVAALSVTVALTVMNMTLIVPVIPDYADEFRVSLAAAAGLISVFAAGRLLFRFWGGLGADRFGARRVALVSTVVVAAGAVVAASADEFWLLLAARAVQGVGVAALGVAANQAADHPPGVPGPGDRGAPDRDRGGCIGGPVHRRGDGRPG